MNRDDYKIEREILDALLGPSKHKPEFYWHDQILWSSTANYGEDGPLVAFGKTGYNSEAKTVPHLLDAGNAEGAEQMGNGYVLVTPYRIHHWPPVTFGELVERLNNEEFRRKYGLPPLSKEKTDDCQD